MDLERTLTTFGLVFIIIGVALILIPLIMKYIPNMGQEKIPWFILYIYRKDGFFFATSPILILTGIIYILWIILHR